MALIPTTDEDEEGKFTVWECEFCDEYYLSEGEAYNSVCESETCEDILFWDGEDLI